MNMDRNFVYGLVYSEFNPKWGPSTVFFTPKTLRPDLLEHVTAQSMRLDFNEGQVPDSSAILPIPEFQMKLMVRYLKWKDELEPVHLLQAQ
ncbi:MAG: hypothetical protein ACFFCS_07880, partial [Candidatus Hodarchaeota archaeon]